MAVLATDNFNRANAANLGANWTVQSGFAAIPIVSNHMDVPASLGVEYYNGVSWPNDQWSDYICGAIDDRTDEGMGPAIRINTSSGDLYLSQTNTSETRLYKYVGAVFTQLGSDGASCTTSDQMYAEAVSTSIAVKKNGSTIVGPVTDSAISSGNAGMWSSSAFIGTSPTGDDWRGGDFSGGGGVVGSYYYRLVAGIGN